MEENKELTEYKEEQRKKGRGKIRKTALFGGLFTLIFSSTVAISYMLTPTGVSAYEPPSSSGNGGTGNTPNVPVDHLGNLLSTIESLPGLDIELTASLSFPKSEGSADKSTARLDGNVSLYMSDIEDYSFALDLEAYLNSSERKSITAGYLKHTLWFDIMGAKYYTEDQESWDGAFEYLYEVFGEAIFSDTTPDYVGGLMNADTSSMTDMLAGINIDETSEGFTFDIGLKLDGDNVSHLLIHADDGYIPYKISTENLTYSGMDIELLALIDIPEDGKGSVTAMKPASFTEAGYMPLVDGIGIVERLYELYQTPRFGLDMSGSFVNLEGKNNAETDNGEYEIGIAMSGDFDLVDMNLDASLGLSASDERYSNFEKVTSTIDLGWRKDMEGDGGNAYISYDDAMKLRMSRLTMDELLGRIASMMPADMGDSLDVILFNDQLKAIANGEYERVIDAVKGFETLPESRLRFTLDLSEFGIGDSGYVAVTLDGKKADQGFAGSAATIEIKGIELGGFALDLEIETAPYAELRDIVPSEFDSLEGLPTIFDQVKTIAGEKKVGFELSGSLLDANGYGMDSLNGHMQFDLSNMDAPLATMGLTIGEYSETVDRDHSLLLDVDGVNSNPFDARFVYNSKMKGKIDLNSISDIIGLVLELWNSTDARFTKFFDPIKELLFDSLIGRAMAGQISTLITCNLINKLSVSESEINLVLDMNAFGMNGDLDISIALNANGEIEKLAIKDLELGSSKLNVELALSEYDEENTLSTDPAATDYMDFSSLSTLVEYVLDTSRYETYHFEDASMNVKLIGIEAANIDLDGEIRVRGADVEAYLHFGGLRDGAFALITEGYSFLGIPNSNRDSYLYYDGVNGADDVYVDNHEREKTWPNRERHSYYKHTGPDALNNIAYVICKEIFSFQDSIYDMFTGDSFEATGDPLAYEDVLTGFSFDAEHTRWDLSIGIGALAQSDMLRDLKLSIYGTETESGDKYLTHLDASLNIGGSDGGTALAAISLSADLTNIGNDQFWVNADNAHATYMAAHRGDAYTVL